MQLRFQRFGRKQRPFYRLVAIDSRNHRDGKALQVLASPAICQMHLLSHPWSSTAASCMQAQLSCRLCVLPGGHRFAEFKDGKALQVRYLSAKCMRCMTLQAAHVTSSMHAERVSCVAAQRVCSDCRPAAMLGLLQTLEQAAHVHACRPCVMHCGSKHGSDCGRAVQYLGWYNPFSKETSLDAPSIKKWLSTGGQPTDTVRDLLKKAMILSPAAAAEYQ